MHQQRLAQVAKLLLKCRETMTPYLYDRYSDRFNYVNKVYIEADKTLADLEKELKVLSRRKS